MSRSEMPSPSNFGEPSSGGFSRRTVLLAGAWAAPAIVVASAVPAASASVVERVDFTNFGMWFGWGGTGQRISIDGCTGVFVSGDVDVSIGPVTVVISVPLAGMSPTVPSIDEPFTAWQALAGAPNGAWMDYTFIWPGQLIAGGAAYSTQMTFHLPTIPGTDLVPPLDWSAIVQADNATSSGRRGTLSNLEDREANHEQLVLQAGTLALGGADTLVWSGASIAYIGLPQPAGVEYVVELHGPTGGVLALLANGGALVTSTPTPLGPLTYTPPAGTQLGQGNYSVRLIVVGVAGIATTSTGVIFE